MTDVIDLLESQHDQIEQLLDGIPTRCCGTPKRRR